jgi:hypothetical protein
MSQVPPAKLIPRNVAALRRGRAAPSATQPVAGNPVSTLLESGVGNCFPGLEFDIRNLERRFFPFLEVDMSIFGPRIIRVASADAAGAERAAQNGELPQQVAAQYRRIADDLAAGREWSVSRLSGTFGPLGQLDFTVDSLGTPSTGPGRMPPDPWTAVRMLTEGVDVVLRLQGNGNAQMTLTGKRTRYLGDDGALAEIFLPGELTQSLCSPWTHDFRDCGCYYWASNHPDIAQPALPVATPNDPAWNNDVVWERSDRSMATPPPSATNQGPGPSEMRHYEINAGWQGLHFVVERREIMRPFLPKGASGIPLPSPAALETHLRYAAGVELAVAQEYLTAAYSLRPTNNLSGQLRNDILSARAELIRIAIGEMRHLRAVNDVLRSRSIPGNFTPALRVATLVPGLPGQTRPVQPRPATLAVIDEFIDIEKPSVSVDSLYANILATLEQDGSDEQEQTVRSIMAEGEDHFQTFLFIREWLGRHPESQFLRSTNLAPPPANNPAHRTLQTRYAALLDNLFRGYAMGLPSGAPNINSARSSMLGVNGIDGAAEAVASGGFLVVFETPPDPRFAPIGPP